MARGMICLLALAFAQLGHAQLSSEANEEYAKCINTKLHVVDTSCSSNKTIGAYDCSKECISAWKGLSDSADHTCCHFLAKDGPGAVEDCEANLEAQNKEMDKLLEANCPSMQFM